MSCLTNISLQVKNVINCCKNFFEVFLPNERYILLFIASIYLPGFHPSILDIVPVIGFPVYNAIPRHRLPETGGHEKFKEFFSGKKRI